MLQGNWLSRWSASPWWPLIVWLGPLCAIAALGTIPLGSLQFVTIVNLQTTRNHPVVYLLQVAVAICSMSLLSYITLAGLCLAWGPGKFWSRFGIYWSTILFGLVCWCGGYVAAPTIARALLNPDVSQLSVTELDLEEDTLRIGIQILSGAPIVLLGFQLPFWISRVFPSWRLQHASPDRQGRSPSTESLSIANLMSAVAIVAVYFGGMQLAVRAAGNESEADNLDVIMGILAVAGVCGAFTTVISLPVCWAFLRLQRMWIPALISLSCASLITIAIYVFIVLATPARGWLPLLSSAIPAFGYVGVTTVGLWLLRWHGWTIGPRHDVRPPATLANQENK